MLQSTFGLRGTLLLTAGVAVFGALLTLVLPEQAAAAERVLAVAPHPAELAD